MGDVVARAALLSRRTTQRDSMGCLKPAHHVEPEHQSDRNVELGAGRPTEDVMRHLCFAIATSAALLAAGASPDRAGAQGVTPLPPDYEPPRDYGSPAPGYEPPPYG